MSTELKSSLVQLDRCQFIEPMDAAGVSVTCVSGSLWITQYKEFADVVLGPGQSFVFNGRGKSVVQALAASTLGVRPPRAVRPRWARLRTLFADPGGIKPA